MMQLGCQEPCDDSYTKVIGRKCTTLTKIVQQTDYSHLGQSIIYDIVL